MVYLAIIYQIHRRKYRWTKKIMLVICYIHRWRSWWNEAGNFFFDALSVSKSIGKIITDIPQITNESFSNE